MWVGAFDFVLPDSAIALRPAVPRDSARMLVVRDDGSLEHARVSDLPRYLDSGDALVLNDTAVILARLHGRRRSRTGLPGPPPRIELLLHKDQGEGRYLAFARPARKLEAGDIVEFSDDFSAVVRARREGGECELQLSRTGSMLEAALSRYGEVPLPPYIAGKRKADARDVGDYQTVFSRVPGSAAAPTAGLHFTPELLQAVRDKNVTTATVTLHVGAGTFLPVSAEDTGAHRMHAERAILTAETAALLNDARTGGGRVAAVGTTSLRTLEAAADDDGMLRAFSGETDIFITPGYRFRACDILLTNFHLPRSTLFMLVCAFAGLERMQKSYAKAIEENYRFYSYGDACLLFRPRP